MRTQKAVPVVIRGVGRQAEILVFEHPTAGTQLVKGTVEEGESIQQASLRELAEESGIKNAVCVRDLGAWETGYESQVWFLQEVACSEPLSESWKHFTTDGGGHSFAFRWHPLASAPGSNWHPLFQAALLTLRERLSSSNLLLAVKGSASAAQALAEPDAQRRTG
jgi:8-oxo-dGTP pyrophosphatase MutT (NUDIX family)